jgi:hypothetical protein
MKDTALRCTECNEKIAIVGSYNSITGEHYCDNCAIDNYQVTEGFKTREAAAAHRRRLFDVSYLLTEMIADRYCESRKVSFEQLTESDQKRIHDSSGTIWNSLSRSQKVALENNPEQLLIEESLNARLAKLKM